MQKKSKRYWGTIEQLRNDPDYVKNHKDEFPEFPGKEDQTALMSNRRDFLKLMGFSLAAASLASCEAPVNHAIPYLIKPVDIDPGISNYYASTYINGGDYCSIVVTTRDGRPIKIEGNNLSKVSKGGTTAQVQGSILSLYDKERLTSPYFNGNPMDWDSFDKEIISQLNSTADQGGQIRIVSSTILSPSTKTVIDEFISKYPNTRHIVYEPISHHGMLQANKMCFGKAILPSYHFDKAEVIVSIGADFLGTWLSPVEFAKGYSKGRKIDEKNPEMSKHYHFEGHLSMTGSNADERFTHRPSETGAVALDLLNMVNGTEETQTIKDEKLEEGIRKAAAS